MYKCVGLNNEQMKIDEEKKNIKQSNRHFPHEVSVIINEKHRKH